MKRLLIEWAALVTIILVAIGLFALYLAATPDQVSAEAEAIREEVSI